MNISSFMPDVSGWDAAAYHLAQDIVSKVWNIAQSRNELEHQSSRHCHLLSINQEIRVEPFVFIFTTNVDMIRSKIPWSVALNRFISVYMSWGNKSLFLPRVQIKYCCRYLFSPSNCKQYISVAKHLQGGSKIIFLPIWRKNISIQWL